MVVDSYLEICTCPKYLDRHATQNITDFNTNAPEEQIDQGKHCLLFNILSCNYKFWFDFFDNKCQNELNELNGYSSLKHSTY